MMNYDELVMKKVYKIVNITSRYKTLAIIYTRKASNDRSRAHSFRLARFHPIVSLGRTQSSTHVACSPDCSHYAES